MCKLVLRVTLDKWLGERTLIGIHAEVIGATIANKEEEEGKDER